MIIVFFGICAQNTKVHKKEQIKQYLGGIIITVNTVYAKVKCKQSRKFLQTICPPRKESIWFLKTLVVDKNNIQTKL